MKKSAYTLMFLVCVFRAFGDTAIPGFSGDTISRILNGREGTFYIVDCDSGAKFDYDEKRSAQRYAPCSTFKIWNTLCGIKLGLINSSDQPFYKWDGVTREIAAWNSDLNVRDAFQASCVPAYQSLARAIGTEKMEAWLKLIHYGDMNSSAGIDVFWLPAKNRQTVLISAHEQVDLLRKLVLDELPITKTEKDLLLKIMEVKTTERGALYGKSGTPGTYDMGWFVGTIKSQTKTYAFACILLDQKTSGLEARAATIELFSTLNLL